MKRTNQTIRFSIFRRSCFIPAATISAKPSNPRIVNGLALQGLDVYPDMRGGQLGLRVKRGVHDAKAFRSFMNTAERYLSEAN